MKGELQMNVNENEISNSPRKGFTLIELVLVVAIVAIISVIAIGKFSDFRKSAARKANVANIKNIARTINTEIAMKDGDKTTGMFAYAESLIDSAEGGGDVTGSEGSYNVQSSWYDGNGGVVPGIYCGVKKTGAVTNAGGAGTGEVAARTKATSASSRSRRPRRPGASPRRRSSACTTSPETTSSPSRTPA